MTGRAIIRATIRDIDLFRIVAVFSGKKECPYEPGNWNHYSVTITNLNTWKQTDAFDAWSGKDSLFTSYTDMEGLFYEFVDRAHDGGLPFEEYCEDCGEDPNSEACKKYWLEHCEPLFKQACLVFPEWIVAVSRKTPQEKE